MTTSTNVSSRVDSSELNEDVRWLFVILSAVICLNGMFGNIVVLCTLAIQSGLKSPHNIFIGHLTLADLFIVGYVVPYWMWDLITDSYPYVNKVHCIVNAFLGFMCCLASILFLWTISCNRYISICHHATYRKWQVTSWRAFWFSVAIWVTSAVCSTFPFYGPGSYIYEEKSRLCFFNSTDPSSFGYVSITIPVIIILASIAFFNFSIFRFWRMNKKQMNQWIHQSLTSALRERSSNNIGLGHSLLAVYVCLVALYIICVLLRILEALVGLPQELNLLAAFLFFTNSSINWLLYSAFNGTFRQDCGYLMARCCSCRWKLFVGKVGDTHVTSLQ